MSKTIWSFRAASSRLDPEAERVASGERRLFQARLASANGQKAQLRERIKQSEEEIKRPDAADSPQRPANSR